MMKNKVILPCRGHAAMEKEVLSETGPGHVKRQGGPCGMRHVSGSRRRVARHERSLASFLTPGHAIPKRIPTAFGWFLPHGRPSLRCIIWQCPVLMQTSMPTWKKRFEWQDGRGGLDDIAVNQSRGGALLCTIRRLGLFGWRCLRFPHRREMSVWNPSLPPLLGAAHRHTRLTVTGKGNGTVRSPR